MNEALLETLVACSEAISLTPGRLEKRDRLVWYFQPLPPRDLALAASYLAGEIPQGKLGVGWRGVARAEAESEASAGDLFAPPPGELTLERVDAVFSELAAVGGAGAVRRRAGLVAGLFREATPRERRFLSDLLRGELRHGALRALVIEGLAAARSVSPEALERAVMVAGSFAGVVERLGAGGATALGGGVQPLVPVQPMLAGVAASAASAMEGWDRALVEWKLDGVRVQAHRSGERVVLFTRRLRDVTHLLPQVVEIVGGFSGGDLILDGEVIARNPEGGLLPFQDLMSAFSRSGAPSSGATTEVYFFDLLFAGGVSWVDQPLRLRRERLRAVVPEAHLIPGREVATSKEAEAVYGDALAGGHEGVIVKDLDAPYAAGRRGSRWKKVKPEITLDLVILAAEWGSGRRRGWLSNLHLGARDPASPQGFAMLGKTFKGLTDSMLQELTRELPPLVVREDTHTVHVEPRRVVEVAFDGVQRSSRYGSGLALRFARVKRFRPDKGPGDAAALTDVRAHLPS